MRGSSWRSEPAAALRGLAKILPPVRRASSLIFSKPACGRNTSPRTSRRAGMLSPCSFSGMARMVRTLVVMSSPVVPSPRVAARVITPFSYRMLTARPSSFSSQHQLRASVCFRRSWTRLLKARKLPSSKTLSSDSMGTSWRTWLKKASGAAPTRWVGESGVIKSGRCASSSRSSRIKRSYSASGTSGASIT